jgi:hypothetical protein
MAGQWQAEARLRHAEGLLHELGRPCLDMQRQRDRDKRVHEDWPIRGTLRSIAVLIIINRHHHVLFQTL